MRRNTRGTASALLVLVLVGTSACAVPEPWDGTREHVLTTFTVLADMTRAVAGDAVEVRSITRPGAEVHDYEPTPSDLLTSEEADLILTNGLGMERWLDRFLEHAEAPRVIASEGIEPIPVRSGEGQGDANPHAWMSPRNAVRYVANIRDALIRLAPEHAEGFRARAADYTRRLVDLDRSLRESLADVPPEHRALVTCEGAFSYLARDAGLREAYLWPVNSGRQGTPQQVTGTTRFVEEHDIPAVFCESTVNDEAQRLVARETGARLGRPLYVDSLSEPGGPVPTYLALLRHDVDAITEGLTGAGR